MEMEMSVDDLSCEWEENGELKVEQMDKVVLSKGAWATIMFLYRERGAGGEWTQPKARIQRFRKQYGQYKSQSKLNISSAKQAVTIARQLLDWFPDQEG